MKIRLTVAQYAKREGISRQGVHDRIARGKLKTERMGRMWIIVLDQK